MLNATLQAVVDTGRLVRRLTQSKHTHGNELNNCGWDGLSLSFNVAKSSNNKGY